jgi:outer membrane receptor protein involved in Fe transport
VNVYGDEASTSMNSFAQAAVYQISQAALPTIIQQVSMACGCVPTQTQINSALNGYLSTDPLARPFYAGLLNNVFKGDFVSRTGFDEKDMVDYDAFNLKVNGGLYYKITDNVEASLLGYWGTGTTVYTGADRYVLKNLIMGQYKAELKGKKWFLRGTTTQENSGDSYTATTAALFVNRAWKSDEQWFGTYVGTYAGARLLNLPEPQAHAFARSAADQGRFMPGTDAFNTAFKQAINTSINTGGAKFDDKTDLYHIEGQYNLSDYVKVMEVLAGASYRIYHLDSRGTIFADTSGPINITEVGGYIQLKKNLFKDILKLTGSLRYDKNENFDSRVTPRATALIKVAPNNSIRLSYQTAYRFPTAQDQYINLLTGGANRLIGGLPQFESFFNFNKNPAYTAESVVAYRNSFSNGAPNPALLQQAKFETIKPENMNSYELGFRGLVTSKFLVDAYVYKSKYDNFIGRVAVGRGKSDNPNNAAVDLASPYTTNNYSFVRNTERAVDAIGWGISMEYQFDKGFSGTVNLSGDNLHNVPAGFFTQFNTPKFRYNIGLSNNKIAGNFGFNIIWRWQDKINWEGTFATGDIPSFGTLDAQVNYQLPAVKSVVKLGGSNIFNHYYYSAFGNPQIGAIYYLSLGYNVF